jgi:NDP-sugar pyrophosphorylase family protein
VSLREKTGAVAGMVLAGAPAWRGTAFDALLPRPVLPVALKPLITYPLEWLRLWGVERAAVCGDGLAAVIRSQLQPYADRLPKLQYLSDPQPRGAAGCVRDAAMAAGGDAFVVVDATTIPHIDLSRVFDEHRRMRAAITVVVQSARETPHADAHLTPTGVYVFSRRALDAVPAVGYHDIKESLIPQLARAGERVMICEADGACPRVLDAQSYLTINAWMVERIAAVAAPAGTDPQQTPLVHATAHVDRSAQLVGPILIGAGARVMAGATLVGPLALGRGSVVERNALLSRSIVWSGCRIGEGAMVDRSVLADNVSVPEAACLNGVIRAGTIPDAARLRAQDVAGVHPEPAVAGSALAFR